MKAISRMVFAMVEGSLCKLRVLNMKANLKMGCLMVKGVVQFVTGTVVEGDFKKGEPNGYGIAKLAGGLKYEGNFKNGLFDEKGKLIYPDGGIYEGDFVKEKIEGRGVLLRPNDIKYEGQFKNNVFDGEGILTDLKEGSRTKGKIIKGFWSNGQYIGETKK